MDLGFSADNKKLGGFVWEVIGNIADAYLWNDTNSRTIRSTCTESTDTDEETLFCVISVGLS